MENRFNLVSKLSLNEMAIRRVVINLWSESNISGSLERLRGYEENSNWPIVEQEVKEEISNLVLPETLKKRMMDLVQPVRAEIIRWILFHEHLFTDVFPVGFYLDIFKHLCWSCTGAIDYRKTAEELVRLKMLDIEKLYRLACWYCLEDYIPVLWAYKSRFNGETHPLPQFIVHLKYYWASVLKAEEFDLNVFLPREYDNVSSTYQSHFLCSVREGNKAAAEYFFRKLTDEERNDAFRRITTRLSYRHDNEEIGSDVLCYLLSLMDHEQQLQFFKNHPARCLMCFLNWPWQDFFFDIADLIWNFLPEDKYDYVIRRLSENMFDGRTSYYMPDFFQKFFIHSPVNFRSGCGIEFLSNFVLAEDAETVRVVLKNLDSSDRTRFIFSRSFDRILFRLMTDAQCHLVELCIREAMLSKEDREVLKGIFNRFSLPNRKYRKRVLRLLDGISLSANGTKARMMRY